MVNIQVFDMDSKELGYYFYQQRIKKGISLNEIKEKYHIPKAKLCGFENGTLEIANYHIKTLCEVLSIELKYCLIK